MTPAVRRVADPLLGPMEARVRRDVERRIELMERELAFLVDREDQNVAFIRRRGWCDERLQVLFLLNSVYQKVLGPLQAAAKEGPEGLGSTVPVKHGSSVFSRQTTGTVQLAMKDFLAMVEGLQLHRSWLHANTCGDAIYEIASYERDVRPD